jgi:hypothetical protein
MIVVAAFVAAAASSAISVSASSVKVNAAAPQGNQSNQTESPVFHRARRYPSPTQGSPCRNMSAGCWTGRNRRNWCKPPMSSTAPRHPAQYATETTAGLLACGSTPLTAFPGYPSGTVVRARRLQLRGQLRIRSFVLHRIPCSLSLERPSTALLNGCGRLLSTQGLLSPGRGARHLINSVASLLARPSSSAWSAIGH